MRAALVALAAVAVLLAASWGVVRHAPFYLPSIDPAAVAAAGPAASGPQRVFGYATLAWAPIRLLAAGRAIPSEPARLDGYRKVGRNIVPDPEEAVEGRVFAVTPSELHRLDRYERLGERYERKQMELAGGETAWVYRLIR